MWALCSSPEGPLLGSARSTAREGQCWSGVRASPGEWSIARTALQGSRQGFQRDSGGPAFPWEVLCKTHGSQVCHVPVCRGKACMSDL